MLWCRSTVIAARVGAPTDGPNGDAAATASLGGR